MFTTTPQRDISVSQLTSNTFNAKLDAGMTEPEAIESLEHNHQKALMMFEQWCSQILQYNLHIWHQHFDVPEKASPWWARYQALATGLSEKHESVARLLDDSARRAAVYDIPLIDPATEVARALSYASGDRLFTDVYQYIAEYWDDAVDPLADDSTDLKERTTAVSNVETSLQMGDITIANALNTNGNIPFMPDKDDAYDLAARVVTKAWELGNTIAACNEVLTHAQKPDFFTWIHEQVPYQAVLEGVPLKEYLSTITDHTKKQEESAEDQANPFIKEVSPDGQQHWYVCSLVAPSNAAALNYLDEYAEDAIDVRDICNPAEAVAAVGSRLKLTGSAICIIAQATILEDAASAVSLGQCMLTGIPLVFIGDSLNTKVLEPSVSLLKTEIHYVQ